MMNKSISFFGGLTLSFISLILSACSADGISSTENDISAVQDINSLKCAAGKPTGISEAGMNVVTLCIDKKNGDNIASTHSFAVEVAATAAEQARGLMFRTELADDKGMLFPYPTPGILSFWMKNTVISLDIIFINEDGSIANIARNTKPYSTDSVSSINPTIAVLEVRAGLTKELGIEAGDIIRWK